MSFRSLFMHLCARSLFAQLIEPGLQNYRFSCVLSSNIYLSVLSPICPCGLAPLWDRVCLSVRFLLRLFPLCMMPVWSAGSNCAKCQAELIYSSVLGQSCVLKDCLLARSVCATDLPSIAIFLAFCALLATCRFPSPFQGIGTSPAYYAPKIILL